MKKELEARTKRFALSAIELVGKLPRGKVSDVIGWANHVFKRIPQFDIPAIPQSAFRIPQFLTCLTPSSLSKTSQNVIL
jgi:hypothetical protein